MIQFCATPEPPQNLKTGEPSRSPFAGGGGRRNTHGRQLPKQPSMIGVGQPRGTYCGLLVGDEGHSWELPTPPVVVCPGAFSPRSRTRAGRAEEAGCRWLRVAPPNNNWQKAKENIWQKNFQSLPALLVSAISARFLSSLSSISNHPHAWPCCLSQDLVRPLAFPIQGCQV